MIKFLKKLNVKSFNRKMISYKQIEPFLLIINILEDPENPEEVYFYDLYLRIGKLNV